MDRPVGSPWTRSVVGAHGPGVSVFGLPLLRQCYNTEKEIHVMKDAAVTREMVLLLGFVQSFSRYFF